MALWEGSERVLSVYSIVWYIPFYCVRVHARPKIALKILRHTNMMLVFINIRQNERTETFSYSLHSQTGPKTNLNLIFHHLELF